MQISDSVLQKFWSKVNKTPTCWIWTGCRSRKGYGQFRAVSIGGAWWVHRLSWVIANGEIPDDLWVLHKCDNSSCVNPDHLYLGTSDDNIRDAVVRNRTPKGSKHWGAKLTDDDAKAILEMCASGKYRYADIAAKYGVCRGTVTRISNGDGWKHIETTHDRSADNRRRPMANGNARLTEDQIIEIRRLSRAGKYTQRQIASMYGISQSTIQRIMVGSTWAWVSEV